MNRLSKQDRRHVQQKCPSDTEASLPSRLTGEPAARVLTAERTAAILFRPGIAAQAGSARLTFGGLVALGAVGFARLFPGTGKALGTPIEACCC